MAFPMSETNTFSPLRQRMIEDMAAHELAGEVHEFVRRRLTAHEYPCEVAFIDDMPMTTTGKVIRRLLRARG
jgi:acyl-coenzyme A synthetase/AMP-(fatty) acid ligase